MRKFFPALGRMFKSPYEPDMDRRAEVVQFLSHRPSLPHEDWHRRYGAPQGIPLAFVTWFRDTCSRCFAYDLSAALPEDGLIDDLGLFDATWGDTDWDILEDYERRLGCKRPPLEHVLTFGQLLQALWEHLPVSEPSVAAARGGATR